MKKILAIGEIIVDMIGQETAFCIKETESFAPIIGGSPANFIHYMALFGETCQMIGTVGADDFGENAIQWFGDKVDVSRIYKDNERSTSLIVLNKSDESPFFISYRDADFNILPSQTADIDLKEIKLLHTTAFALSQNPAQRNILDLFKRANAKNISTSVDFNYSNKIWNNRNSVALEILHQLANGGAFIKMSDDDAQRLYGKSGNAEYFINELLDKGAKLVCYTCGKDGAYAANRIGKIYFQAANESLKVVDTTGAGDAYWAAFLHEYLKDNSIPKALEFANEIVAKKLEIQGPILEI